MKATREGLTRLLSSVDLAAGRPGDLRVLDLDVTELGATGPIAAAVAVDDTASVGAGPSGIDLKRHRACRPVELDEPVAAAHRRSAPGVGGAAPRWRPRPCTRSGSGSVTGAASGRLAAVVADRDRPGRCRGWPGARAAAGVDDRVGDQLGEAELGGGRDVVGRPRPGEELAQEPPGGRRPPAGRPRARSGRSGCRRRSASGSSACRSRPPTRIRRTASAARRAGGLEQPALARRSATPPRGRRSGRRSASRCPAAGPRPRPAPRRGWPATKLVVARVRASRGRPCTGSPVRTTG